MLLRPGSFTAGALATVFLFFVGKRYLDVPGLKALPSAELRGHGTSPNDIPHQDVAAKEGTVPVEPISVEKQVANSTFGFQKILAIGLPERTDRRDTLRLMSTYQGVELTWIDAIRGETMSRKAWPPNWHNGKNEGKNLTLAELGCWRSHSNALLQVIEEGYASALIIEDDVDWDIGLKAQLNHFAEASRNLDNDLRSSSDQLGPGTPTTSPYGDHWDLLWLGTCANPPVDGNKRLKTFASKYDVTHFVYPIGAGAACTFAYGITQESARMLFGFMQNADKPVDFVLGDFCAHDKECRLVWPQLISSRAIGRDSDIRDVKVDTKLLEQDATWNIKNSAVVDMLAQSRPKKKGQVEDAESLEG